jgi:hypothetical protein
MPTYRNPDGKRRAEAYFALEKKAIAVLMGEEASDERKRGESKNRSAREIGDGRYSGQCQL